MEEKNLEEKILEARQARLDEGARRNLQAWRADMLQAKKDLHAALAAVSVLEKSARPVFGPEEDDYKLLFRARLHLETAYQALTEAEPAHQRRIDAESERRRE